MRSALLSTLLLVVAVACGPPTAQESTELETAAQSWQAALNAGDLDAIVGLYAADARLLPPNGEMGRGAGAVEASFGGMIDDGLQGELETIEAMVAGDLGYRMGTYKLNTGDGTLVDEGKYIEIWRREGGEWKISADIWNSDLPVAIEPSGTTLVISHEVEDGDHWLAAWQAEDGRHAMFAEHGAPSVRTFQNTEDPNQTGVVVDVTDMEAFMAFLSSPEGQAAKDEDGLIEGTMRVHQIVE